MKFTKAWDKTKNYLGDLYDILDDKVRIFLQLCRLTEIQLSQCWAVFPEMLSGRAETYYMHHVNPDASFAQMYWAIKSYFDTESNHALYYQDWTSITLVDVRCENTGKTLPEAVEILVEKLHLCQCALGPYYISPEHLVSAIIRACQGSPEMSEVLSESTIKFETLVSRLRAKAAIMQKKEAARSTLEKPVEGIARHLRDHGDAKTVKIMALNNKVTANVGYRHAKGKANVSDKTYRAFLMDFEASYNITSDSEDEKETNNNDEDEATVYFMVG
ncbi:hypothetical protein TSTA_126380 [Talaromyces stipitatus ATCC 10500]|uniref:Uncharacterized protein n=1 Tax=Talaromyces stipitatus (strain ATCC 10500 / CBS 375.48 / QM 6759 / NRRL 1006) TaxID=441959 RepID=B8MCM8_TALSN|nr:uncharacterized protein TSTA_126380 [Talaromyces stipitatus ATCC 10500]EED18930.1 hypothetical protein TSTA_126380 [Talaromyces stipitatus ATCC 10500]